MFDPQLIRKEFPILETKVHGKALAYLDNAGSSQKPRTVIEAINNYYSNSNANVHRGIHYLSEQATAAYEEARATVAKFINAAHPEEIIFTSGTTDSINLVAHNFGPEHHIAVSHLEHHANFVPWQGSKMTIFDPQKEIPQNVDLIAITGMSNVTGEMPKIPQGKVLVDAAQLVMHQKIDVQAMDCDFLVFSGHKLLGPTGIGVLYAKKEHLEKMKPLKTGGGMIKVVNDNHSTWAEIPEKFEAGTPNIAGAIGLKAAIDFLSKIDYTELAKHEEKLAKQAHQMIAKYPEVTIHSVENSPIISFTMDCAHPHDIASILDQEGVAIRAGHHCCQPLMRRLDVPATARASLYLYNNEEDVAALERGIQNVIKIFK